VKIALDEGGARLVDFLDDLPRCFFIYMPLLHDRLQPPFQRRCHQDTECVTGIGDKMTTPADDDGLAVRKD